MAITIYKIELIRKALDKYKKDHSTKTDTGAINEIVNQHHELVKQLKQANAKIERLQNKLSEYESQRKALASALSPFIKQNN